MKEVSVFDAKMNFSSLVDRVHSYHESIIITRKGEKIAQIVLFEKHYLEKKVETVLKQLQILREEIAGGMTLDEIKKMKTEGRL
jgi:prevent-host-death family protein